MGNINNYSIFGHYNHSENKITAALLQILKVGGTDFIRNIIAQIEDIDFPTSEIRITTQTSENNNVYDGLLECDFAFRLIIESKLTRNSINRKQLEGIVSNATNKETFVIYLTPDNEKPEILNLQSCKIYWANWEFLNQILNDQKTDNQILCFLVNEFEKLLNETKLIGQITPENRVQIAAGAWGEPIALEYGFYACQNNRSIRESRFLTFYNNRRIKYLFEIVEGPHNNFDLCDVNDLQIIRYLAEKESNYKKGDLRQFYKLKLVKDDLNIPHNQIDVNGRKTPFTMGVFRYTTKEKILNAKTTDML